MDPLHDILDPQEEFTLSARETIILKASRELANAGTTYYNRINARVGSALKLALLESARDDLNGATRNLKEGLRYLALNPSRREKPALIEALMPNLARLLDEGLDLKAILEGMEALKDKIGAGGAL